MRAAVEQYLHRELAQRNASGSLRRMTVAPPQGTDLYSNDYLGLAHSGRLDARIQEQQVQGNLSGSTGSRLLSGNSTYTEQLEAKLAAFYGTEAALIFNSGYDANLGLLSALPTRHDTILYDELCHASIIDGIRLSQAKNKYKFRHGDLDNLRKRIALSSGRLFIVVESVYSMDGDEAPLSGLADLAAQYDAALIVDEAHATGLYGEDGKGLVSALKLEEHVFARVHTFGKALAAHGAVVCGSAALRDYLINFARSFIYTTALPLHAMLAIAVAHELIQEAEHERQHVQTLIAYCREQAKAQQRFSYIDSSSPIQAIITGGNTFTRAVSEQLIHAGLLVKPILSPTVEAGKERLRICLHSFNTQEQVDHVFKILQHA